MRILPVNLFRIRNIVQSSESAILPKLKPMPCDSVSFGLQNLSLKQYKKLGRFLGDFYTGNPLVYPEDLTKMKKRNFFTGPIIDVVQKLKPYYQKKYFQPTAGRIYEMMAKAADNNPKMNLTELFNTWYIAARKSLRKQQKPIFDRIKTLGAQLPVDKQKQFYNFMQDIDRMLYDEPIHRKFSLKEFSYKIEKKFLDKSPNGQMKQHILKLMEDLKYVHEIEGDIPESFVKKLYGFKSLKVPGKKSVYYQKHLKPLEKDKQALEVKIIHEIGEIAKASGYKKVTRLCNTNIDMLNGLPVTVPFSNKAFVYDLSEIISDVPNKKLVENMIKTAQKLPTSASSTDAFILKLKDADPNIIGNQLFDGSLYSWEHVLAKSKGGPTTVENLVPARKEPNNDRGNEAIHLYLKRKKYDPKIQTRYVERWVKLCNRGKVPRHQCLGQIEQLERETHMDFSAQKAKLNQSVESIKR